MKAKIYLLSLLFVPSLLFGSTKALKYDIAISVKGLGCEFCIVKSKSCPAKEVNKNFIKLNEVTKVFFNKKTQIIYLILNKNNNVTNKLIHSIIEKPGIKVLEIKRIKEMPFCEPIKPRL